MEEPTTMSALSPPHPDSTLLAWPAQAEHGRVAACPDRPAVIHAIIRRAFAEDAEFARYRANSSETGSAGLLDYLFAVEDEPHGPAEIFDRLRWGGQVVYASRSAARVEEQCRKLAGHGMLVLRGPDAVRLPVLGLRLPLLGPRWHFAVARKVLLIPPRQISDRFTYQVELVPGPDGQWLVRKEVPTLQRVLSRLQRRFPGLPMDVIERRARKFTERIFPLFLTREAAMLKILQKHLPPQYARRVPTVLRTDKDDRGFVQRMWMRWLRVGGPALSQMDFASQSAELLDAVHQSARIIHLDLRLDNFVITDNGVGFVDFGSAVRVGEDLSTNALLSGIFQELLRASQLQHMLEQMINDGSVTSDLFHACHGKADKAMDLFYLAMQVNDPLTNPDLRDLIQYDPASRQAKALARLTEHVLRPANPRHPPFRSAADIVRGIERLQELLNQSMAA